MAELSLFGQQDASSSFDHYLDDIKKEIESKSSDHILNVDIKEWREYFINKYEFIPITLYSEKAITEFIGKGKATREDFGRSYEIETYRFEIRVPFTGSSFLFMLKPSTCVINFPRANVPQSNSGIISSVFTMYEQDSTKFEYEKDRLIKSMTANVPNINTDVQKFNQRIGTHFDQIYNAKKEKVTSENSFFDAINIKVNKDTESVFKVPTIAKKSIPEPVVDEKSKRVVRVPALPGDFYDDVVKIIYDIFKAVEKKPSIYQDRDEEGLRDYVLPTLETRYIGTTATGETFNSSGKTDILLKYQDGTNLFIAECKFWKGEAEFHKAINQLFDKYLTWRDSKVAIILFVTNKDFSKVLDTIRHSVEQHPYYLRDNGTRGESSFSYIFHFPDDKEKFVFTEIMMFRFNKKNE